MEGPVPLELALTGLARVAGRRHLLRDVTTTLRGGEVVALVGRNGAGKTTLLSLVGGRNAPDRGRIDLRLDGRAATSAQYRATVGMLPHDLLIYPDLTARENLEFFATLHAVADPKGRAREALDRVGLTRDADRTVRTYSRGMQQRAALGRLLVSGARVWLLDEPTTGLDEGGRRWLLDLINERGRGGGLVVMSSHHPAEVSACATRTLVLDAGRLVLDGPGGAEGAERAFARVDGGAA